MVIGYVNGYVVVFVFVVIVIVEGDILERYVWKAIWRRRHHPWLMLVDALQCWRRSRVRIALACTECSPHSLNPTPLVSTIQKYRRENHNQQQSDSSQHAGNDNGTLVGDRRGILTVVSSVSRRALASWVSAHTEANGGSCECRILSNVQLAKAINVRFAMLHQAGTHPPVRAECIVSATVGRLLAIHRAEAG
jgi:hypothetical protein